MHHHYRDILDRIDDDPPIAIGTLVLLVVRLSG